MLKHTLRYYTAPNFNTLVDLVQCSLSIPHHCVEGRQVHSTVNMFYGIFQLKTMVKTRLGYLYYSNIAKFYLLVKNGPASLE